MRNLYLVTAFLVILLISFLGFRGTSFTHAPMNVFPTWAFPSMTYQSKYRPQGANTFFADQRDARPIPAGTVPADVGPLAETARNNTEYYEGKDAEGQFIRGFPASVKVDIALLQHGQDRFDIYCAPCHGRLGDGQGITKQYGMGATPSYNQDNIRAMPEGQIYNTITHGFGNMLSYADKLTPSDRWAVVAYVRALQLAEHATAADVPDAHKPELGLK